MNVVDSSGWLEYFADGPGADFFAEALEDTGQLIVPTICLFEVFKTVLRQRGENEAIEAVAAMRRGTVVDIDANIAITGARLSAHLHLPMADSLIFTVAVMHEALFWTQEADFKSIEGVSYREKRN